MAPSTPPTTHAATFSPGSTPQGLERDWLLANGTGAFAMGSLPNVATRRYHGLLVASTLPPAGRVVLLNQTLEQILIPSSGYGADATIDFGCCPFLNEGQPVFSPEGFKRLVAFEKGDFVTWRYEAPFPGQPTAKIALTRTLRLHWHEQAATITYHLAPVGAPAAGRDLPGFVFRVAPLASLRDFHALLLKDHAGAIDVAAPAPGQVTLRRAGHAATLFAPGSAFKPTGEWWYALHYAFEARRGQDCAEDLFLPGWFEWRLPTLPAAGLTLNLTVALGDKPAPAAAVPSPRQAHLDPIARRVTHACELSGFSDRAGNAIESDTLAQALAIASDDFVVDRFVHENKLATIIAGYPWFADWGRDTFIAFSGLLLCTGRFDEARSTLRAFAGHLQDGLVPNFFDERSAAAAYNTVDASLWYIHAAIDYVHATSDLDAWRDWLGPACIAIVEAYIRGTSFSIKMGGDCLISAGNPQTQLTWMDAKCGDVVFTPRHGKAVEINALWYNALCELSELLKPTHPAQASHYAKLTDRIGRSFAKVFWNEAGNCLFDHVYVDEQGGERADASIRPNQIFAASLRHSPLPRKRQVQVVEAVRRELLTPFGLRTLASGDKAYRPHYVGGPFERDSAYHQGTVWPWLMGPYIQAVLRSERFSPKARAQVVEALSPMVEQLMGPGLGQLHEIHDAEAPHTPAGCPAQAWSVAGLLSALSLLRHETSPRIPAPE